MGFSEAPERAVSRAGLCGVWAVSMASLVPTGWLAASGTASWHRCYWQHHSSLLPEEVLCRSSSKGPWEDLSPPRTMHNSSLVTDLTLGHHLPSELCPPQIGSDATALSYADPSPPHTRFNMVELRTA